jgi:hypothetical protein
MLTAPDCPFEQQSSQQLTVLLRRASNRLEMLQCPNQRHHEDDAERRRIQKLDANARAILHREVIVTIRKVRAEIRRRASLDV